MENFYVRRETVWRSFFVAVMSLPVSYLIFQMKDVDYLDIFMVNFMAALRFYYKDRDYQKCKLALFMGAYCYVLAILFRDCFYVACPLISYILYSWFSMYLDDELPMPYPIVQNAVVFWIFKHVFEASVRLPTATYILFIGLEYLVFVEKQALDLLLFFPVIVILKSMTEAETYSPIILFFSHMFFCFIIWLIHLMP